MEGWYQVYESSLLLRKRKTNKYTFWYSSVRQCLGEVAYRIQEQSGPLSGHDHPSAATAGLWADLDSIPTDSSTNNVAPPSSHLLTLMLWVPWLLGQWPLLLQPFSPVVHITSYAVSLVSVFVFLSVCQGCISVVRTSCLILPVPSV